MVRWVVGVEVGGLLHKNCAFSRSHKQPAVALDNTIS